jgi:hypothetical protein
MKNYMLVVRGAGEGCDYTLGCNVMTVAVHAETREDARALAKKMRPSSSSACIPWASATLVEVIEELPVASWVEQERAAEDARRAKKIEKAERKAYEKLKARFEKG